MRLRTTCACITLGASLITAACAGNPRPDPGTTPSNATSSSRPASDTVGHDAATRPIAGMTGHDMSGMDMGDMKMPMLPATDGPGYTAADVHFMQDMIGHHAQAIVMSGKAPSHGANADVLRLAQKIAISQRDEIAFMKRWLSERNQVIPTDSQSMAMMMPGMLTPAMMAQLDAARGRDFDRLFLTYMIGHHRGALQMVADLFRAPPAGQEPEVFRFASDVDTDQKAEIYVMQELLDAIR